MPKRKSNEIAFPATINTGCEIADQQNSTQQLTRRRRHYKQNKRDDCGSEPEPEPEPKPEPKPEPEAEAEAESESKSEQGVEELDPRRRLTWQKIRNEWRELGVELRQNLWEVRVDLNEAVNALPEETWSELAKKVGFEFLLINTCLFLPDLGSCIWHRCLPGKKSN